jgi:hypothetical protein
MLFFFFLSHLLLADENRLRLHNYSEWMTNTLGQNGIAYPQGDIFSPSFVSGRVVVDYRIAPETRLFYWQAYFLSGFQHAILANPRLGLRLTQLFDVAHLKTLYDFYVLPSLSGFFTVGSRMNHAYSLFAHFDLGLVMEWNFKMAKFSGLFVPWLSYRFSSCFSTQHWLVFPLQYVHKKWSFSDMGMPFVQNGIGYTYSSSVFFAFFVNNYLFAVPMSKNTWFSVWIDIALF